MVDQEGKLEKAGEAVKLLKSERQDKILDILLVEKKIIASEMSVRLGVSEDTIRRDIKELDQKGLLKKVHSGAVRNGPAKTGFCQRMGTFAAANTWIVLHSRSREMMRQRRTSQ